MGLTSVAPIWSQTAPSPVFCDCELSVDSRLGSLRVACLPPCSSCAPACRLLAALPASDVDYDYDYYSSSSYYYCALARALPRIACVDHLVCTPGLKHGSGCYTWARGMRFKGKWQVSAPPPLFPSLHVPPCLSVWLSLAFSPLPPLHSSRSLPRCMRMNASA